jgi:hypothetical protein
MELSSLTRFALTLTNGFLSILTAPLSGIYAIFIQYNRKSILIRVYYYQGYEIVHI